MAIIANRSRMLLLLSAGAAVSYAAGLMPGFWLFFGVGVVLELIFWREFFRRR